MTRAATDSLNRRKYLLGIAAVLGASVLASLDLFIVNLAFPQISRSFPDTSPELLSWVLNAYVVLFAAFMAPAGRLADHFERKTVFQLGLLAFILGTIIATAAHHVTVLVIARGVQGVGAAILVPVSLALLTSLTSEQQHKKMVSIWAATGSAAAALGPALGGVLAEIDWRWVFAIKLPIAVAALLATRALPTGHQVRKPMPDVLGATYLAAAIAALVITVTYWSAWTVTSILLWVFLLLGCACLGLFIHRSRNHPAPAVDLAIFRNGALTAAAVGMTALYLAFSLMLLGATLWATNIWQWSSALTGVVFIAGPGTAVVSALLAGRAALDARWYATISGALFVLCSVVWLVTMSADDTTAWAMLLGLFLTGAAAGIGQTGFLAAGVSALPQADHGTASGIINTARQIGAALGVALLIGIVGAGTDAASYSAAWATMGVAAALAASTPLVARMQARPAVPKAERL